MKSVSSGIGSGSGGTDGTMGSVAQPKLIISPPLLNFGTVAIGATSDQTLTLTNSGTAAATSLALNAVGSGFTQAGTTCGSTLAIGASCTVSYRFAPTANAQYGAAVIASSANGGAVTGTLQGTGGTGPVGPVPVLEISPSPIAFPKTTVGSTADLAVTIRNTGTVSATSLSLSLSGNGFTQQSSTCAATLAAGSNCIVTLRFNPPGNAVWTGTLVATASQALATSATISGEGTGGRSAFSIAPSSHAYGSLALGAFSDQVFTITNTGSAPAEAATASIIGAGFTLSTHNCARALNVGDTCQATVRFSPSSSGNFNGFLTISAAGADTSMASLSGSALTGAAPKGILSLSPVDTAFASTNVSAHADQTITVTNTGNAPITNLAAAISGSGFSVQSSTCIGTLGVGASCTVIARFAPAAKGTYGGYIKLTADDAAQAVGTLSGNGVSSVTLALTPSTFDFGAVTAGQVRSVNFVLRNTGSSPASAISVTSTDTTSFPITFSDCNGITLAGGASCQISVSFQPTTGSLYSAQLQVADSVPNTVAAGLRGEGVIPTLSVTPSNFDFGSVVTGAQATRSFIITNAAAVDASGFAVNALGTAFSIVSNGCAPYASNFPAGQSCSVTAQFSPPGSGTFSGFVTAAATGRTTVYGELTGVGGPPAVIASTPTTRAFGTTFTSNSPSQVFTLTNTGGVPATSIASTLSDSANYAMATTCTATLAPGDSCTITLTYHPLDETSHPATLTVDYFNGVLDKSTTLTASGTGRFPPALAITPASHDFGTLTVGNGVSTTFGVQNTGLGYASSAVYSTTDPSFTILSNNCPTTLAAGASCSITVEFAPNRLATFNNALQIEYAERTDLGLAPASSDLDGVGGNGLAWNVQNESTGTSLTNIGQIAFSSPTTGYISRGNGLIKKTEDGGLTWRSLASGTWSMLHAAAYNLADMFVLGANGTLKWSDNGGLYWETLPYLAPNSTYYNLACPNSSFCLAPGLGSSTNSLLRYSGGSFSETSGLLNGNNSDGMHGIAAPDSTTSYVIASYSTSQPSIMKSEDGGLTYFTLAGDFHLKKASAGSGSFALAAGEKGWIRRTWDAGLTWQNVKSPLLSEIAGLSCANASTCWMGGTSRTSGSTSLIFRTTDGGQTWQQRGSLGGGNFYGLATAGPDTVLVGPSSVSGPITRTTDGGSTWQNNSYLGVNLVPTQLKCFSATDCYATYLSTFSICNGGCTYYDLGGLIKSSDGGTTWKEVFGSQPLNSLARVGTTLWAAGNGGHIQKSTDGGVTWRQMGRVSNTTAANASGIYFLDSNTGWVTLTDGRVYRTTDGGSTWTTLGSTISISSPARIQIIDSTTGWISASSYALHKTTNGGSTWSTNLSSIGGNINAIQFLDANRGWLVASNSIIRYTTDGGATWSTGSVPTAGVDFQAVYFKDALNGFAGGSKVATPVLFKTTDGGATWSVLNTGVLAKTPRRIIFNSAGTHGWMVGTSGLAQRTSNGGTTWNDMPLPTAFAWTEATITYPDLTDLAIVDDSDPVNTVLVVTTSLGAIFRSTDSGSTWTQVNYGMTERLFAVQVDPANSQVIMAGVTKYYGTGNGYFLKTTDGGETWSKLPALLPCKLSEFVMFNSNQLLASCTGTPTNMMISNDGGGSWSLVSVPDLPSAYTLNTLEILDRSAGRVIAVGRAGFGMLSQDFGATWTRQTIEPIDAPYGIKFVDANRGWVVGLGGMILKTIDGGINWERQSASTVETFRGVDFLDSTTGFVVGLNKNAYKTTNGGSSWTSLNASSLPATHRSWDFRHVKALDANTLIVSGASGSIARWDGTAWSDVTSGPYARELKGVVAFDRKTAYAIDQDGAFYKTTDGVTWSNPKATGAIPGGLVFMNRNVGWAPRYAGMMKTTDGGTNWTPYNAGSTYYQYHGLHYFNENKLWIVGDSGKIQYTTNGGTSWTLQTSGTTQTLKCIWVVNETTAFVVGAAGTLLKTTNAGTTWTTLSSGTTNNLNSVYFLDANTGWIAGAGGVIKKTTDGGATWTSQNAGTTTDLYSIRGLGTDPNLLWATGTNVALYTVSGGTAWVSPTPSVNAIGNYTYNAVAFGDAYTGWIVGTNGIILKTTTGGRTP